jgi:hypothetical protein
MPEHKPTFTIHGIERALQRAQTAPTEMLARIEQNLAFPIGEEANTNRRHEILYLPEDQQYISIIRDTKTEKVITCLPPDYHETCAWQISDYALKKAKKLSKRYVPPADAAEIDSNPTTADGTPAFKAMVRVLYKTSTAWRKTVSLGSHPLPFADPAKSFSKNIPLRRKLRQQLIDRGVALTAITDVLVQTAPEAGFARLSMDVFDLPKAG